MWIIFSLAAIALGVLGLTVGGPVALEIGISAAGVVSLLLTLILEWWFPND